jgi:hypothetical protein
MEQGCDKPWRLSRACHPANACRAAGLAQVLLIFSLMIVSMKGSCLKSMKKGCAGVEIPHSL